VRRRIRAWHMRRKLKREEEGGCEEEDICMAFEEEGGRDTREGEREKGWDGGERQVAREGGRREGRKRMGGGERERGRVRTWAAYTFSVSV
jgi:hypothetical protein